MVPDPESSLFARFRDDDDVDALGQLYDLTAPELLRVAIHLVREPARAEDLVQQTFLAAIEAAPRFDASRRVRAWLLGILNNQARKLQRDEARVPPNGMAASVDPLALAQTEEFTAQVDAAISTLPEVYQPVLVLRLKHGMIAAEIAHALRRAPGTVRTQLVRALELLKKALPPSIAISAFVLLTPVRGLAAVKVLVLARATSLVATRVASATCVTSGAILGGVLAMKILVIAVVAAVLAVVGWIAWSESEPHVVDVVTQGDAPSGATALFHANRAPAAAETVARELVSSPVTTRGFGSLRYRLLWEQDRTPAVGVFVHVVVWGRQNPHFGKLDMATDANGEIVLAGIEPGTVAIYVDRADGDTTKVVAGEESVGTIMIPRGITVHVRVEDEQQRAIAGARVWLSSYGNGSEGREIGVTNANGELAIRDVGEARQIAARADGYAPTALVPLAGKPGERVTAVLTMLGVGTVLDGTVRTDDGRPCADAVVCMDGFEQVVAKDVYKTRSAPPPFVLRTDASGRFHAAGLPAAEVRLRVRAVGTGTVAKTVALRVGERNQVDLRLPLGARVSGFVRDQDGRGIAGAQISGGGGYGLFGRCSTTSGPDGSYTLQDLSSGQSLTLHAACDSFLPVEQSVLLAAGEQRAIDFELPQSEAKDQISGQLVDEHDQPLCGWVVDIQPIGAHLKPWSAWLRTDSLGCFAATACPYPECEIAIFDPEAVGGPYPILKVLSVQRGTTDLRIRVPSSLLDFASLSGLVLDAVGKPLVGANIAVRQPGVSTFQNWRTDSDGRFHIERLPARRYEFEVHAVDHPVLMLGDKELLPKQHLDLGSIVMPRGGRLAWRPSGVAHDAVGRLSAAIYTPAGECVGRLERQAGVWTSDVLAAGKYVLQVVGDGIAVAGCDVEVLDGQTQDVELELTRGSMHAITIRGPRSDSWSHLDLVVTSLQGQRVGGLQELARRGDGAFPCAVCLGVGSWQVEARTDTGLVGSAIVQVLDAAAQAVPVVIDLR